MIKRTWYLDRIQEQLSDLQRVLFLIGARQVGKTSLLHSLVHFGYIKQSEVVMIEWDRLINVSFSTSDDLLAYVKTITDLERIRYLIIDEAQYINNINFVLKTLIDEIRAGKWKMKIIVSGSGSLQVFQWMSDSLIGRKKIIHVFPFSFQEFCLTKWIETFDPQPWSLWIYQTYFEEYLLYGWYPSVVLAESIEQKQDLFVLLLNDYLFKDVALLLAEQDIIKIKSLLAHLATFVTSMTKISTLAEQSWISRYTLEKYLFVLENTFLFYPLQWWRGWKAPWEIKKMQKRYAHDLGMLRYLLGLRSWQWNQKGQVVENYIANQLIMRSRDAQKLYFRNTKGWAEVDFVLHNEFDTTVQIREVKSGNTPRVTVSLQSFLSTYADDVISCTITSESVRNQLMYWDTTIDVKPFLTV